MRTADAFQYRHTYTWTKQQQTERNYEINFSVIVNCSWKLQTNHLIILRSSYITQLIELQIKEAQRNNSASLPIWVISAINCMEINVVCVCVCMVSLTNFFAFDVLLLFHLSGWFRGWSVWGHFILNRTLFALASNTMTLHSRWK